jgi:LPS-assembly protein
MRRLIFCLLVLIATVAPAGAQTLSIAGCEVLYSTITPVTDPASGETVRTEWRRTDGLPVEVRCPDLQVFADDIDLLNQENRLDLRGRVVFQQGGTRIAALSGTVDLKTRLGSFESASGTLQLTDKQVDRSLFGSMEPEATFNAARIEKTGPQTYRLTDATFTTCVQPSRRWQVYSSKLTFTVNRYAIMTNARLEVKDVPLLYLPVFYYPISEDDRATGFLMPSYGTSTFRGFTLSNAFFWAINRSQDLTVYHDWFTRTGHGLGADYRYVGHGGTGDIRAGAISQKELLADDGSIVSAGRRSYEFRGNLNQTLPGRLRMQGRADYFTDATTSQLYQSDIDAFSRRQRYFGLNLSGSWGLVRATAQAERNDVFYGSDTASSYRYQPLLNLSVSQTPIAGTKIYVGGSWQGMSAVRYYDIDSPDTRAAIRRSDGSVTIRAPYSFGPALEVQGALSFRRTDWNVRRDPNTGETINAGIARNLFEVRAEMRGPVFTRIWDMGGGRVERLKHVIEPSVTFMRRSAFEAFDEVFQFDGTDTVVGGNTQVTYRLTNRLLGKIRQDGAADSAVRQLASLDISQTYYTDALAASYDVQYQSSFNGLYFYAPPPSKFSPVQVTLDVTPTSTTSGQFGLEYDTRFRAVRTYRASASFAQPWADFRGSWSKRQLIPELDGFSDPRRADHFLTLAGTLKRPDRSGSVTYATTLDLLNDRVLQQRLGFFYNAQCCGVAVDYVVVNMSHYGLRNIKRFSLSFSLAGIGSFVNPFGVFGNNDQR